MTDIDNMGQKLKGKAQQAKGELKQNMGDETGGFVDKAKGKFNEAAADVKSNNDTEHDVEDEEI